MSTDTTLFYDMTVVITEICASPTNPRKTFDDADMQTLIGSVQKHGVLQPVLLRPWPDAYQYQGAAKPRYELVAGERRWRAAKAAGLPYIPARVRELTDQEVLEIQIIENLQRAELHPLEEAEGYELMLQSYGYTADTLAEKIGKSKAYVYARMKLTALCHTARKAFREGKLNPSTALLVARIPSTKLQEQALAEITEVSHWQPEGMSVREAADHIQEHFMLHLKNAPFPPEDVELVSKAGPCSLCPKRTGNAPADLFDDVKSADVCTDTECFAKKKAAHIERVAKAAKESGKTVITGAAAEKIIPYGYTHNMTGGHVSLDERCFEGNAGGKTYRELLGDNIPEVILVENSKDGTLVETVKKSQMAEAFKAAGIQTYKEKQAAENKKRDAKADIERAYRQRLHANIRTELLNTMSDAGGLPRADVEVIATSMFQRWWHDAKCRIVKLWGAATSTDKDIEAFEQRIPSLTDAELFLLLTDLALESETAVEHYNIDRQPEKLLAAAERYGIDPAEIRKEVAAEAREKAKPPTQAARAAKSDARGKSAKTPAPEAVTEAPKPAAEEIKVGDRVRMNGGDEGTVEKIRGKKLEVAIEKNGVRVTRTIPATYVEKLPPATQAAQAEEQTATETVVVPKEIWPFPTTGFEKNRKAAASAAKGDIEKNAKPSAEVTA